MHVFPKSLLAASIGFAVSYAADVSAQDQNEHQTIEEVVVSAQMREQSLQDVPMSVSAFDEDFLESRDVSSYKKLFDYTPGVSGVTNDSFFDAVSVRGINNNGFGSGSDPAIGVFMNGTYHSRSGATPTFFDLSSVEVVKGPQGTLFGRNTASGAISAKTNRPTDEFGAKISAEGNDAGDQNFEGFINIPVTDDLAVRLAGLKSTEEGYVKNLAGGRDLGESDTEALRLSISYDLTDSTNILFVAQDETRTSDGTIYRDVTTVGAYDEVANDTIGADNSNITDFSLTITHEFNDNLTLTSITGQKDHDYLYREDFDGTAENIDTFERHQDGSFFSQEFRLAGSSDSVNWVVGVSYYEEDLNADFLGQGDEDFVCNAAMVVDYEYDPDYATCSGWAGAFPDDFDDAFGTVSDPMDPDYDPFEYTDSMTLDEWSYTKGKYKGWGAYANVDFNLTESLILGVGARYTVDEKSYSVDSPWPDSWTASWNYLPFYTDGAIERTTEWDNISGRVTLTYMLSDDLSIYGSFANGYKSGGFNYLDYDLGAAWDEDAYDYTVDASIGTPAQFDEETVESFEVGMKSMLMDGRMQLNLAVFSHTYEGLQQNFYREGSGGYVTENIAEVTGQGVEGDLRILLTDDLDIMAGFSVLDTELQGAPDEFCEGCNGNKMAFSPEFSGYTMATYSFGQFALTGEYIYNGEQEADLANSPEVRMDAYGLVNARLTWHSSSEALAVTLFGENLTGEEFYRWGYAADGWMLGATQTDPSKGAEYGLRVSYTF